MPSRAVSTRTAAGSVLPANRGRTSRYLRRLTLRLFVMATQVRPWLRRRDHDVEWPLRIGGNSILGEFFQGRIDELRIYNRALSAPRSRPLTPRPLHRARLRIPFDRQLRDRAGNPVDLKIGPNGDLFYVDIRGDLRRIGFGTNQAPSAVANGAPLSGPVPLTVNFSGSGSSDPDPGDTITTRGISTATVSSTTRPR